MVCVHVFLWCWQNLGVLDIVCGNSKARVIANVLPLRPSPSKFYVKTISYVSSGSMKHNGESTFLTC